MSEEIPRLSPWIASKMIEAPIAAWAAHRLLGNFQKPPTDSQIAGTLWHAAILDTEDEVAVIDADSFRTKEARELRDAAIAEGKIPVTADKWHWIQVGARRILANMADLGIVLGGVSEERIEWDEFADDGKAVACSGVLDHRAGSSIVDIKTGPQIVTPHMASMLIAKEHSIFQDAAYRSASAKKCGGYAEDYSMTYVFVQTEEPYAITPVKLDGEFREVSHLRWRRAINAWHECLSKGRDRKFWPGPVGGVVDVHPPGWLLSQEIEMEVMA